MEIAAQLAQVEPRLTNLLQKLQDPRVPQLQAFLQFLNTQTCWLKAPASSTHDHHNAFDGGLRLHSLNVAESMLKVRDALAIEVSDFSCVIVGLFHDLGKIGDYTDKNHPLYIPNVLKSGSVSEAKPYRYNTDLCHMPVAVRSLYMVSKFIDLYEDEAQAIVAHDGQYIPDNRSYQHNESPLLLIAHLCDMWQGHVEEGELRANPLMYHRAPFKSPE